VSANTTAYTFNVDTLDANGALEEGSAAAIAKGVNFSGNDHYLITQALNFDTTNGLTLSAWVLQRDYQIYSAKSFLGIVNIGGGNISPYYQTLLGYYKTEKVTASTSIYSPSDPAYPDGTSLNSQGAGFTTGAWHHVAGVYRYDFAASNTALKVYVDGALRVNTSIAGRALRPLLDKRVCVGAVTWSPYPDSDPVYHISGSLDEVRISKVSRSEAWLKASFQNQKAADALLEVGRVEPPPGTVIMLR